MTAGSLVLASASPQRRAILEQLGVAFSVRPSGVAEMTTGHVSDVVAENARRKAAAVAAAVPDATVVGVDTVVALDAQMYGKPIDAGAARATLTDLSGRRHRVVSGVCVMSDARVREAVATTAVDFRVLSAPLIDWYLGSGEWRERAGGYAIQGRGAALVAGIVGDYFNVVGLPVALLLQLLPQLLFAPDNHG